MKPGIYKGPTRSLSIDDDDLLTIAKGVVGEGGEGVSETTAASYLWAIMNRCLLYSGSGISYVEMWKAFSQPINPKWRRDGLFCQPGGKGYGKESCSEERLARRDRIAAMDWSDIPASVTRWVLDFQAGYLPMPTHVWGTQRMTNWAAVSAGTPEKFPWGMEIGDEWFFEDRNTRSGTVSVEPGERQAIPPSPYGIVGKVVAGVAIAALAGIGWLLMKTHLLTTR